MQKPKTAPTPQGQDTPWQDKEFSADYPFLYAFLSENLWDDGTPREPGTLTLFTNDKVLKAVLNDRAANRSAFITAPTLTLLFDAMDGGLEADALEWRSRRQ